MNYEKKQSPLFDVETGLATGFIELDRITSGLQAGELVILAARPGMGKTSLALNIANHVALELSQPVVIFSMECNSTELAMRMVAADSRVSDLILHIGNLESDAWPKLTASMEMLTIAPIFIDDTAELDVNDLCSRAQRIIQEESGLGLIIIDYLQLMNFTDQKSGELRTITQTLKQLAIDLNVPIILLSQLDRRSEQRLDKRPQLSDLDNQGAIEQNADMVIFIHREECYSNDPIYKGNAELIVCKNRHGPIGNFPLVFIKELGKFDNPVAS